MDQDTWLNLLLVVVFVLIGGVFAATELALVSLRQGQIDRMESEGGRAARTASLARDPNRFLSAVQIGVTVMGFLSAAFGAATLAPDFAPLLVRIGMSESVASTVALVLLTLFIAYLSLVFGELVPKRIALQYTEKVAKLLGPPLDYFARLMRPVVWLLSVSTNGVVRLLGGDPEARGEEMSEEELRTIVAGHQSLSPDERRILTDVMDTGDRTLQEVMTPRPGVTFMPADLTAGEAREIILNAPYSRYPVVGTNFDDVLGFLHVRDLLGADEGLRVSDLMREVLLLPATNHVLPVLTQMRAEGMHIAVVVDEYGGTDGIVTLEDLVEELVGEIHDEYDPNAPLFMRTSEGVLRVNAGLTIEEFQEVTGVELEDGNYETAAGYLIERLGRLAEVGDGLEVAGTRIEVAAVQGNRIIALDVTKAGPEVGGEQSPTT
ncbi:MAG: hemolysin family protein [Scrofimicrobium sp.]